MRHELSLLSEGGTSNVRIKLKEDQINCSLPFLRGRIKVHSYQCNGRKRMRNHPLLQLPLPQPPNYHWGPCPGRQPPAGLVGEPVERWRNFAIVAGMNTAADTCPPPMLYGGIGTKGCAKGLLSRIRMHRHIADIGVLMVVGVVDVDYYGDGDADGTDSLMG